MHAIQRDASPFALLDLLGFSAFIESASFDKVWEVLLRLVLASEEATGRATARGVQRVSSMPGFVIASDTLFMYPDPDADDGFYTVVRSTARLVRESIVQSERLQGSQPFGLLPLRGAISCGSLAVTPAWQPKGELVVGPVVIGSAVSRAHRWEQQQKWIGASVCPISADLIAANHAPELQRLKDEGYLVEMHVPTANARTKAFAVNYVQSAADAEVLGRMLKKLEAGVDEKLRSKYVEARRFVEAMLAANTFAPLYEEPGSKIRTYF